VEEFELQRGWGKCSDGSSLNMAIRYMDCVFVLVGSCETKELSRNSSDVESYVGKG
jgi:hypothetical protein